MSWRSVRRSKSVDLQSPGLQFAAPAGIIFGNTMTISLNETVRVLPPYHIEVKFGPAISNDTQGKALLAMERYVRETLGVPVECYKETMPDDLKRRRDMTPEQRENL